MPNNILHIALLNGDAADSKNIRIDGRQVYHNPNLTTRIQINLADSSDIPMVTSSIILTVRLPQKNVSESLTIDGPWPVYPGIILEPDNKIRYFISLRPFHYLYIRDCLSTIGNNKEVHKKERR